jgi:hypothetical protein
MLPNSSRLSTMPSNFSIRPVLVNCATFLIVGSASHIRIPQIGVGDRKTQPEHPRGCGQEPVADELRGVITGFTISTRSTEPSRTTPPNVEQALNQSIPSHL